MDNVVAIANDHAGVALKAALAPVVAACGFTLLNLGTDNTDSVDYPDYGRRAADSVAQGKARYAIIICGSGIGISIAANRVPDIRAALCHTPEMASLARQHNDANILALGARFISDTDAAECVRRFLTTDFEGGRHTARVEKLG